MICILEHISKNTCDLVSEAHTQTGLKLSFKNNSTLLADLYHCYARGGRAHSRAGGGSPQSD
jgi:hypothetical protein